jgi:hypothetical protein
MTNRVIVTAVEDIVSVNIPQTIAEIIIGDTGPQGPRGTQVLSGPSDPSPIIGLIGDQYLNTTTGYLFGPKTESGWGTGVIIVHGLQLNDVAHVHYQTLSSDTWNISHDLDFTPSITVVDLAGNVIEGDYKYNGNTIVATFSQGIAGTAFLS